MKVDIGFVYLIHNADMTRFYIGSTNDTYRRFKHHQSSLRRGKHHCTPLQRAWDKYGEAAFDFTVLLQDVTRQEASAKEHELLSVFYKKRECLNISSNGLMAAQCPVVIAKRNATLKSETHRSNASIISKSWREANPQAAKEHDLKSAKTRQSKKCRGENSARMKEASSSPESKEIFARRMKNFYANGGVVNAKQIIRIEPDGKETSFKSISEAGRALNVHINGISMCCLGKRKTAAGSQWKFQEFTI